MIQYHYQRITLNCSEYRYNFKMIWFEKWRLCTRNKWQSWILNKTAAVHQPKGRSGTNEKDPSLSSENSPKVRLPTEDWLHSELYSGMYKYIASHIFTETSSLSIVSGIIMYMFALLYTDIFDVKIDFFVR